MARVEAILESFNKLPNEQRQRLYLVNEVIQPPANKRLAYISMSLEDLLAEALSNGKKIEVLTTPRGTRMH